MRLPERPRTVKVQCPVGHNLEVGVDAVEITHTTDVVVGVAFACDRCCASVRVEQPPSSLGALATFGVRLAEEPLPAEAAPAVSSDHRRTLSARLLAAPASHPS